MTESLSPLASAPKVIALLLAGGDGKRVGMDRPKQYVEVDGESVIHHLLKTFAPYVDDVLVVCHDEWREYVGACSTCRAGATGFESLRNGVASLSSESGATLVMVHDAVRPLVSPEVIIDNLRVAREHGNAIASVEVYETLFHAPEPDGIVRKMVRREGMFRAQTPHTFTLSQLREMIAEADARGITDVQSACTLAFQLGYELHLSHGDLQNFKITTPSDLELYEALVVKH